MTDSDAAKILTVLATAFPDDWRWLDDEQQEATRMLYRRMIIDLDYPRVDAAVTRLIATARKMPKVSEIRLVASRLGRGREHKGLEAWGVVRKQLAKYGRGKIPGHDFVIDDPITRRVVDAMGWAALCTSENLVSDRARFCELYDELALEQAEDLAVGKIAPPIPQRRLGEGPKAIGAIVAGAVKKLGASKP